MALVKSLPSTLPEVRKSRLVIALDYGTTYTGLAFALIDGKMTQADLGDIKTPRDWGNGIDNDEKVPSVYSYTKGPGPQWGGKLAPGSIAMVHTKLQLQVCRTSDELDYCCQALEGMNNLDYQSLKAAGPLPEYTWDGPEVIVRDFLTRMVDSLKMVERSFFNDVLDDTPVDIVATIPAGWKYASKNFLFQALTAAGFNHDAFPLSRLWLISEPEAAAIFTARSINLADSGLTRIHEQMLRLHESFVLCDAGGGTVDVVSYQVKQLLPRFEIARVTTATSRECGSIFINIAFKTWLRRILGDDYRHLDPAQPRDRITSFDRENQLMRTLMERFNIKKKKFRHDHQDMPITLPGDVLSKITREPYIHQGQLNITYDIMKSFFDPLMGNIVNLIESQIQEIRANVHERRCRNVFLVGGFAQSQYLNESLALSLSMVDNIQIQKPDHPLTAVVRGAAIVGIERLSPCEMTACPRSYGIAIDERYSPIKHHIEDRFEDPISNSVIAREQLKWLIKKGDLILSNQPQMQQRSITVGFEEFSPRTGRIPIYAFNYKNLPDRLSGSRDELDLIHTIQYDLSDIPLSEFPVHQSRGAKPAYSARLDLTMQLEPRHLLVRLAWKRKSLYDKTIGITNAQS